MKDVWLEEWFGTTFHGALHVADRVGSTKSHNEAFLVASACVPNDEHHRARVRLAAAAPTAARALLLAETNGQRGDGYHGFCAVCDRLIRVPGDTDDERREQLSGWPYNGGEIGHDDECELDKALTKAGLESLKQREEARRVLSDAKRAAR